MREHATRLLKRLQEPCCYFCSHHRSEQIHPEFVCVPRYHCGPELACRIQAAAGGRTKEYDAQPNKTTHYPRHTRSKSRHRQAIADYENNYSHCEGLDDEHWNCGPSDCWLDHSVQCWWLFDRYARKLAGRPKPRVPTLATELQCRGLRRLQETPRTATSRMKWQGSCVRR